MFLNSKVILKMLTSDQIEEYKRYGVLVIENVLTDEEVDKARQGLHDQLLEFGIDHYKVLMGEQKLDEGVRLKSTASKIFYSKWKMDICFHEKVYNCMRELLSETYLSGKTKGFEHSFGPSDDILSYIDRVCWRLPDIIRAEGGLELHLDRNPTNPYSCLKSWRPIQAFVCLTDHYGSDYGGLKVVKGFHHEIDDYFANSKEEITNGDPFHRLHSKSHYSLAKRLESVIAPKGSLVCWDNRLSHATSHILAGSDTREVVYVGWLPNVELNGKYCEKQLSNIRKNIPPHNGENLMDMNWIESDFNELQLRMLGI